MRNILIVLSGPSGVGKGTIVNKLLEAGDYALSISCTTREPREGEADGREYFFKTRDEFLSLIEKDGLLEYSIHFENYYGTPKKFVEEQLKERDVILEIDVDGALQIKKTHTSAILIMIAPPSVEELRRRLMRRGTECVEKIEKRIERMDYELSKAPEYDYTIVNDDLQKAVEEICDIILKEKSRND